MADFVCFGVSIGCNWDSFFNTNGPNASPVSVVARSLMVIRYPQRGVVETLDMIYRIQLSYSP